MFKLRLVLFAALALASTAFMPAMPATKAAVRAKVRGARQSND